MSKQPFIRNVVSMLIKDKDNHIIPTIIVGKQLENYKSLAEL